VLHENTVPENRKGLQREASTLSAIKPFIDYDGIQEYTYRIGMF
jgi:hypothetical protein